MSDPMVAAVVELGRRLREREDQIERAKAALLEVVKGEEFVSQEAQSQLLDVVAILGGES